MNPDIKKAAILALIIMLTVMAAWEYIWRSEGYFADIEDNESLFVNQWNRIKSLDSNGIILLGSSRIHFDINLDVWEDETGNRPLQLAGDGKSPAPFINRIIHQTQFRGTLIIGVSPGLFFAPKDSSGSWNRAMEWSDYIDKQTYAQKLNHLVDLPLQSNFAFLNPNELRLNNLLERLMIPERKDGPRPFLYFPNFGNNQLDRNKWMYERVETDTVFRNAIRHVWMLFGNENRHLEIKDSIFNYYGSLLDTFRNRGGIVLFIRCPSSGPFLEAELKAHPRAVYWDGFLEKTGSKGIHYEDYEKLNGFECPEWSHLNASDARIFTKSLVGIIKELNGEKE